MIPRCLEHYVWERSSKAMFLRSFCQMINCASPPLTAPAGEKLRGTRLTEWACLSFFPVEVLKIARPWVNDLGLFYVFRSLWMSPARQTDIHSWRTTTTYSVRTGLVRGEDCLNCSWNCWCKLLFFQYTVKVKVHMIGLYKASKPNTSIPQGGNWSGSSRRGDCLLHMHTF